MLFSLETAHGDGGSVSEEQSQDGDDVKERGIQERNAVTVRL
jgi:hypothetical protein